MSAVFLHKVAPALRHRNFRRYFMGQIVSVIGSWIQTVAISWAIYRVTNSVFLLGLAAFLIQGPQLVLTPLVGVWIDRCDKKRFLLAVQVFNLFLSTLLFTLAASDALSGSNLLVASALLGVLNSCDTPLRQSLLISLVDDKRDLSSAIALNASVFTTGRFVGPLIAGLMLSTFSEAACFLANALSFLALIAALLSIKLAGSEKKEGQVSSIKAALLEGFAFARRSPGIRTPLALLAIVNVTASSSLVLAPVFVAQVMRGDSVQLGWLLGAAGAGAVLATLLLAGRHALSRIALFLSMAPFLSVAGLWGLAAATRWDVAIVAMFLIGAGIALTNVTTNSLLQNLIPQSLRGRLISLFAAIRFGMDAVGGLLAGWLASLLGPGWTVLIESLILLALSLALFPSLKSIRTTLSKQTPGPADI
ncbi:MAG: MFS transporter [Dechloromonas agitata]|uniref:MFS transporter n=1 Tax=Dechloromonas agitata TaxID=73030 RepID=A0A930BSG8_9RHOO|nr:MFS transporter [Dechloromonas agitata]